MELATQAMNPRHHIYGIDFSGAKDKGKKIWTSKGIVKGETLLIEDCFRARKMPVSRKHSCRDCMVGSLNKCNFGGRVKNIPD